MLNNLLEIKGLNKKFGNELVLSNISLQVRENSIYGLLGPNGAGKSTILKIIAGLLKPTSGEVIFDGHKWKREDLKKIGALIESPPLYNNLTAFENLKVHTTMLDLPDSRINEVLELVDLCNTGKKRAGQFSMGMKQRLGIAIAILNHPKLLILDEPTNGLDPIGIQELRELILSFPKKGITVIVSSHILSEIEHTAEYIGIVSNGVIGYQERIHSGENLEQLFLEVVKKNNKKLGDL